MAEMIEQIASEPTRTRDRILRLLLKSDHSLSVQALAAELGISRNAAHQHVSALEREGLIDGDAAIRTRGRPSRGYRLSDAGNSTFPRQYALIARQLLGEMTRHLGPDEMREALERVGESLAHSLPVQSDNDPAAVIASVAGLMRGLGYESDVIEGAEGKELEARNCVFHDLAMADPRICEVDLALLRATTGRSVDHKRCMARGEKSCRFAFGAPAKSARTQS